MISITSIWEEESIFCKNDFVIIGGGLAGLWCAYELRLQHKSARILIVEKDIIPSGASTRNAGFACFGSPTEMIYDADVMGEDTMWANVEMRYKGIEKIRRILGDDAIDYDPCGGFECLSYEQAVKVDEKLEWLNNGMMSITGNANSFAWCNYKAAQFGLKGFDNLIENRMEGGLHSGKLLSALQILLQSKGVIILRGIDVQKVTRTAGQYELTTSSNQTFIATNVLYCTNAFTQKILPQLDIKPARGQVIVTAPIKNLQLKGTFHYDEGFYYFRNVGDRVLLGGARNKSFQTEHTTELLNNTTIQHELIRFLSEQILPGKEFTISHNWSGIMGFTSCKKPLIQQVDDNAYAIIACNGMGVALTPVIAEQVAALF